MKKGMKKCEILMQYEPPEFKQALEVLNACAAEGWFDGELDCAHCPARKSCLKFWDNFVANTDSLNSGAPENSKNFRGKKSDHYLETIAQKFTKLFDQKHGYKDTCIENFPPTPSYHYEEHSLCHCEERSDEAISSGGQPVVSN